MVQGVNVQLSAAICYFLLYPTIVTRPLASGNACDVSDSWHIPWTIDPSHWIHPLAALPVNAVSKLIERE